MEQIFETIEERYLGVVDKGRWLVANGRIREARTHLSLKATSADMDEIYAADDADLFALCTRPVDPYKACLHGAIRIFRGALYSLGDITPIDVAAMTSSDRRDLHLFHEKIKLDKLWSYVISGRSRDIMEHVRRKFTGGEFAFNQAHFEYNVPVMTPEAADYFFERGRAQGEELSLAFLRDSLSLAACLNQDTSDYLYGCRGAAAGVLDRETAGSIIDKINTRFIACRHDGVYEKCKEACSPEPPSDAPGWMKHLFLLVAPFMTLEELVKFRNPRLASLAVPIALLRHSAEEFQSAEIRWAAVQSGVAENVAAVYSKQETIDPRESLLFILSFAKKPTLDVAEIIYSKHHPSEFTREMVDEHAGRFPVYPVAIHLDVFSARDLVFLGVHRASSGDLLRAEACWRQQLKRGGVRASEMAALELKQNSIKGLQWLHDKLGAMAAEVGVPRTKPLPYAETVDEVRWLLDVGWYEGIRMRQTDAEHVSTTKTMSASSLVRYLHAVAHDFPTSIILGTDFFKKRRPSTKNMYGICAALGMDLAQTEVQVKRWVQTPNVESKMFWPHMFEVYGEK